MVSSFFNYIFSDLSISKETESFSAISPFMPMNADFEEKEIGMLFYTPLFMVHFLNLQGGHINNCFFIFKETFKCISESQ